MSTTSEAHEIASRGRHYGLRLFLVAGAMTTAWFLFLRFLTPFRAFTPAGTALLGVTVALAVFGLVASFRSAVRAATGWAHLGIAIVFFTLLLVALIAIPALLLVFGRAMAAQPLGPHGLGAVAGSWWFCAIGACYTAATRWYVILPLIVSTYAAFKWAAGPR